MKTEKPLPQKFYDVFLVVTEDERILIPAYGMRKTEKNVNVNNRVKLALGTKNVLGTRIIPEQAL